MHFTKEEQQLSGCLPHSPTTAAAPAQSQQDTQDITQAAATDAPTASPELGQLTPSGHMVDLLPLPPEHDTQQNRPHEPPVQKAKPDRRDMLAAVLGIKTPADRMAMQGPPEPPVAQKLNPNNAAFDPVFAAEYRTRRAQDPHYVHFQAQKRHLKLQGRLHWVQKSAFTAEEHGYLLDLGGECSVCVVLGRTLVWAVLPHTGLGYHEMC